MMPSSPRIPASSSLQSQSAVMPEAPTSSEKRRESTRGDGRRHVREPRETVLTPHTAGVQAGAHRCLPTDIISRRTRRSRSCLLHLGLYHYFLNFKMNVRRQKWPFLKVATLRAPPREGGSTPRRHGSCPPLGPQPRSRQHWPSAAAPPGHAVLLKHPHSASAHELGDEGPRAAPGSPPPQPGSWQHWPPAAAPPGHAVLLKHPHSASAHELGDEGPRAAPGSPPPCSSHGT